MDVSDYQRPGGVGGSAGPGGAGFAESVAGPVVGPETGAVAGSGEEARATAGLVGAGAAEPVAEPVAGRVAGSGEEARALAGPMAAPLAEPMAEPLAERLAGTRPEAELAGADDVDLLAMDLETLRTTEHPVLADLLADLRERVAAPGGQTLWAFDNVSTPNSRP